MSIFCAMGPTLAVVLLVLPVLGAVAVDGSPLNATDQFLGLRGSRHSRLDLLGDHSSLYHSEEFVKHRVLMGDHNTFAPLACNSATCSKTSTWTSEGYNPAEGTVVIPCGHCIVMDFAEPTLVLPFGLDVQGRLAFRANTYKRDKLTIVTPFVRVQGNLRMKADGNVVGADPNVKIILTDSDSGGPSAPTSFVPADSNMYACSEVASGSAEPCDVGSKAIVVAGGILDVEVSNALLHTFCLPLLRCFKSASEYLTLRLSIVTGTAL